MEGTPLSNASDWLVENPLEGSYTTRIDDSEANDEATGFIRFDGLHGNLDFDDQLDSGLFQSHVSNL